MTPLICASPHDAQLAQELSDLTGFPLAEIDRKHFSDGELYQRVSTPLAHRAVILVGTTHDDASTLQLYDLACALVRYGARALAWLIPYFGHQTMERAVQPGEVVTAKTRARLVSTVPTAPFGNHVVCLDLHAPGIPHYFGDHVTATHLYAKDLVFAAVRDLTDDLDHVVLASPDAGRAKWVESLAHDLGVDVAIALKRRVGDGDTRLTAVSASVRDRDVVIYDDMIRTGSTLRTAAQAFRDAGARRVFAVATHLVFPGDALAQLRASQALDGVAGSDSHPRARTLRHDPAAQDFLTVRPVAPIFARWLQECFREGAL